MQKKIIALAVAGLVSGTAFAQSNVTIYGVADLTFDRVEAAGSTSIVSGTSTDLKARNRVSANSSHIGFKGTESLGGGLNAVFQLESTVGIDSATGITLNRDSFVGVAGGFGTVVLGNLTGPTRGLGAAMDINAGATGIGANSALLGKLGGATLAGVNPYGTMTPTVTTVAQEAANMGLTGACTTSSQTCASLFDTRWTNAIAYVSPNFGGVSITAAYVANENKTREDVTNKLATWGYDVGVRYEAGPILVGLTQNQARLGDTYSTKATDTRFAARYNFGMGTVGLVYDRVRAEAGTGVFTGTTVGSSLDVKRNAWLLPVTFNVGSGKIIAQYGQAGDVTDTSDTGAKMIAVGYEHSLSKRTMLKAVYSQVRNEASAYYDFGVNAVGNIMPGADPKGFQVGVRHSF
jgi:predicted porin